MKRLLVLPLMFAASAAFAQGADADLICRGQTAKSYQVNFENGEIRTLVGQRVLTSRTGLMQDRTRNIARGSIRSVLRLVERNGDLAASFIYTNRLTVKAVVLGEKVECRSGR